MMVMCISSHRCWGTVIIGVLAHCAVAFLNVFFLNILSHRCAETPICAKLAIPVRKSIKCSGSEKRRTPPVRRPRYVRVLCKSKAAGCGVSNAHPCAKTPLCAILMKTTADIAAAPRVRYLQRDHNTTNREGISTCTHAMSVGKFAPPQSWALIHTQHAATMSDGARAGSTDASQASQASRHEVDSTRPYIFGAGRGTGTK